MSVLSDAGIGKELAYGELDVSPVDLEEQLQPNSLDIRLGSNVSSFKTSSIPLDVREEITDFDTIDHDFSDQEWFKIEPNEFILADTIEYFDIPDYLYGQLNGRSSLARLGIEVHSTGGVIDSGFSGDLVLELSNNAPRPIKLYPGMRIGQVIFHELSSKCSNPYSSKDNKYQGQEGVVHSRLSEEL